MTDHPRQPRPGPASASGTLLAHDLAYGILDDLHWVTAGSTAPGGPAVLPERRATQAHAPVPVNLDIHVLAAEHEAHVRHVAALHGDPDKAARLSRTEVAAYAAGLTEDSPEARAAYERTQLLDALEAACTIHDAIPALARISCPACWCWSALIPVPAAGGGWRAVCQIDGCVDPSGGQSRFTLEQVVDHHLADPWAA